MALRITRAGVGLTVGIIILALVVLGGLLLVKERGEQARREDAIEIAQQNLESQSQEDPALTPPAEEQSTTDDSDGSTETDDNTANGATDETTEEASPEELPQTGPADSLAFAGAALLSFAGVSYIVSRRTNVNKS